MKFNKLFRKELADMLNKQTIFTMIITVVILVAAGQVLSKSISDTQEESASITICDQDKTEFTKTIFGQIKDELKSADAEDLFKEVEIKSDDYPAELKRLDINNVLIIPKGFTQQIENNQQADVKYVSKMTTLATLSASSMSDASQTIVSKCVQSAIYGKKKAGGQLTDEEIKQLDNPVNFEETTVVSDKSEKVSSAVLQALCSMQGMVVPILMFVLIMYSSQMILGAISTEKTDKTLETLLSAPVSRLSVRSAKMLSAGVVAAIQAIIYMIGMNQMMKGLTENIGNTEGYDEIMNRLGLTMNFEQYVLVGLQMFMSILIALSISLVLGVLATDAKSAQSFVMPINFAAMIPYFLSIMVDIKTLSPVVKYIVYAIPFTHTFMASENVMFGNKSVYWGGFAYQAVFLAICLFIAMRIFMSDRVFTMSLGGKKERKNKKLVKSAE